MHSIGKILRGIYTYARFDFQNLNAYAATFFFLVIRGRKWRYYIVTQDTVVFFTRVCVKQKKNRFVKKVLSFIKKKKIFVASEKRNECVYVTFAFVRVILERTTYAIVKCLFRVTCAFTVSCIYMICLYIFEFYFLFTSLREWWCVVFVGESRIIFCCCKIVQRMQVIVFWAWNKILCIYYGIYWFWSLF